MALGNVHLTPQLVQAVRDAVDITDVAGEHTKLQKAGKRLRGLCPLHKEKTPSFSIEPDQGLFYCFGCGQGGDAIKLHMLLSGDDFPGAIESLARRYGIPLPAVGSPRGKREERDLEGVLVRAEGFFRERLAAGEGPRAYLAERGIPEELVEAYRLGLAPPGWRNLLEATQGALALDDLIAAGLVARSGKSNEPYDRFRDRLMFPIRDPSGRLVGFGGRALDDDKAKYLNTAETARFHKGRLLYGLDRAKRALRETNRALLVEGYFDVLGAVAAGEEATVAGMGTALTPEQARLLARYADEVVVGYDADEAGERAFRRVLPLLLAEGLGVRRLRLPAGHDPDSFRLAEGGEALRQAVAEAPDGVSAEIERLTPAAAASEPRAQAAAAREVGTLLEPLRDGVLRYAYARRAAERLAIPVELLWKRTGAEKAVAAGAGPAEPAQRPQAANLVRSLEEQVLQLLLTGQEALPEVADLPPPEAFFHLECRNIFLAFLALYDGQTRPAPRQLLGRLDREGSSVDRVARLLIESPVEARSGELAGSLAMLKRRWQQQRLRELSAEIAEAQRLGEPDLLERLLRAKTALSLDLHRP
jgi:DNA primase